MPMLTPTEGADRHLLWLPRKGAAVTHQERLFQAAVANVLEVEGGLVSHPHDPGGITNFGISLRAFPHLGRDGIKRMTRTQAAGIYRTAYWNRIPATLPDGLRWMAFDAAVNHGVGRALEWLREHQDLAAFTARRLRFYTALSAWPTFGKGWTRRMAHVLEGIATWSAQATPAEPPEPAEPAAIPVASDRVGEFEHLVLHDLTDADLVKVVAAHLRGEPAVLGRTVVSVTPTATSMKLDARREPA